MCPKHMMKHECNRGVFLRVRTTLSLSTCLSFSNLIKGNVETLPEDWEFVKSPLILHSTLVSLHWGCGGHCGSPHGESTEGGILSSFLKHQCQQNWLNSSFLNSQLEVISDNKRGALLLSVNTVLSYSWLVMLFFMPRTWTNSTPKCCSGQLCQTWTELLT